MDLSPYAKSSSLQCTEPPARFLPSTLPTRVRGRMTKRQMQVTATIVPKGIALEFRDHLICNKSFKTIYLDA